MARGSVKLSILSSYDDKGTQQAERAMERFARKYGQLNSETKRYELAADAEALARQSIELDRASQKWAGYSKQAAEVSRVLAPISAAAGAAIGASVKLASDYESGLAKVSTIADETVMSTEELGHSLLQISTDSGKAVTEIEEAAYQALSASVSTEKVGQFVSDAANLAKAGFTTTATSVDVLTTAINAYGMQAEDAAMISDKLVQTQNAGKTTVDELGQNLGQVIPTASAYGVSLDNLLSSYVVLTKQGINTANSTTQINRVLTELADTGSDVSAVLAERTGKGFADLMADGWSLYDVLQVVMDGCDGDKVAFSNLWGSAVAGKGALAIVNGGAEEFSAALEGMENASGNVSAALDKLKTPSGLANKAMNSLKNTGVELGEVFLAAAAPALEDLAEIAHDLYEAFDSLDETERQQVATALAIAAAAAPAAMALSKLFGIVSRGYKYFAELKAAQAMAAAAARSGAGASAANTSAMNVETAAANRLRLARNLLAGAGIALLAFMAGSLAEEAMAQKKRSEDMARATDGLRSSVTKTYDAVVDVSGAVADAGGKYESYGVSVSKARDKQLELVDAIEDIKTEEAVSQAKLTAYGSTIEELAGKSNLTREEQARLKGAVEGLNEVMGSNIEIVDLANGKLDTETESIKKLIEQKREELRLKSLESQFSALYEQQTVDARAYADALSAATAYAEEHGMRLNELRVSELAASPKAAGLLQDLDDAKALLEATNDSLESLDAEYQNHADTLEGDAGNIQQWVNSNAAVSAILGGQARDFEEACADMGVSVDQLEGVNQEALHGVLAEWIRTGGDLSTLLSRVGIETGQAGSDAAQAYASGVSEGQGEVASAAAALPEAAAEAASESPDMSPAGAAVSSSYASGIDGTQANARATTAVSGVVAAFFSGSNATAGGQRVSTTFAGGIDTTAGNANASAMASNAAASATGDTFTRGWNLASGFAAGIAAGSYLAVNQAIAMATAAIAAIKAKGGEGSPWRTTKASGRFAAEGLALGMLERQNMVERAAGQLALSAIARPTLPAPEPMGGAMAAQLTTIAALLREIRDKEPAATIGNVNIGDRGAADTISAFVDMVEFEMGMGQ